MEGIAKVPSIFYSRIDTAYGIYRIASATQIHYSLHIQLLQQNRHVREVPMTTQSPHTLVGNWRDLYTAALFETDKSRVPNRIADAEKAIVARARELFSAGADTIEEDQALDDALYALRALQNCLQFRAAA
jgi:hypothetical protein